MFDMSGGTGGGALGASVHRAEQAIMMLGLLLTRTRQRLYALEAERDMARAGRAPARPIEFRSQFGEDLIIWDALGRPLSGFFIEVGAFDGYSFSATYALECMGWTGLLVEGIPERCAECRARRPGSRVVHAALGAPGGPPASEFTVTDDPHGGMLSYLTSDESHKRGLVADRIKTRRVTVPRTTMNDLLQDHAGEVDAAVIDVEGGELDLLAGFDLARYRPKVVIIEDNSRADDSPLGRYMALQPYKPCGWAEVSRIYIRSDLPEAAARLRLI